MYSVVRLVIPSVRPDVVGPIVKQIVDRYGGATTWTGQGWWKPHKAEAVVDEVTIVEVAVEYNTRMRGSFVELARKIAREQKQETVYLSARSEESQFVGPAE